MHKEIIICVNVKFVAKNNHTTERCYYRYSNTVGAPKSQNYYAPQNKNNSNLN